MTSSTPGYAYYGYTYCGSTHYGGAHDEEHAGLAEVVEVEETEALVRALPVYS